MTLTLTRTHLLFFFSVFWLFFISLSDSAFSRSAFFAIIACASLLIVPGVLTLLVLRLEKLDFWTYLTCALAFSILECLFLGLLGNTLLPYFGVDNPLDRSVLLSEFSIFVAALIAAFWVQVHDISIKLPKFGIADSARDFFLATTPALFLAASIIGATLLNNGGSNVLIFSMLVGAAMYSALLLWYSESVGENVIPIALFFLALAFLFMTSLRGFYITGHDIQREYQVFELTKNSGVWAIAHLRDAYNACLSITILPTIIANISHISDPYVFKVVFQMLFATVPSMLYLFVRRYTSATIALVTTLYFISFPTFFSDMPFLNRQEIAFLFLFASFLIISDERLSLRTRRILFVLFGVGMVLSHYSTTYTIVALLLSASIAHPLFTFACRLIAPLKLFRTSAIAGLQKEKYVPPRITIVMALILALSSFLWSSVLTDTSSNSIYRVVAETISVMRTAGKDDTKSNDVAYGLFSHKQVDPAQELKDYDEKIVQPLRAAEAPGTYFSDTVLAQYPVAVAGNPAMPLTFLGNVLTMFGVNVPVLNAAFRETSAKVLQILILIGCISIFFSAKWLRKPLDTEYLMLALGSLGMLVAIIVLPVLSAEYGLLRAFQQSLLFLGIFIVLGNLFLFSKANAKVALGATSALVVIFMLSSTGVLTQSLGGYTAQLHLNNAGTYYDLYYVDRGEIVGTEWLLREMRVRSIYGFESGLAVDTLQYLPLSLTDGVDVSKNIYPGFVRTRSYMLVGAATLKEGRATILYNSDVVPYQYPLDFLDENKDLLYSNGDVAVYR